MKRFFSITYKAIALLLAVVLAGSNLLQAVQAVAAHSEGNIRSVTDGELIAVHYDELSAAEKALLSSGLLVGDTHSFGTPDENEPGLIAVDVAKKVITLNAYNGGNGYLWNPVNIGIYNTSGALVESPALGGNAVSYTYGENAFSVKADYTLTIPVDKATQMTLLKATGALKDGLGYLKAGYGQQTNLSIVVEAIPVLMNLANGLSMSFGNGATITARFGADAIAAVRALDAQQKGNSGKLNLQVQNQNYAGAASKTQFLLGNGSDYRAELVNFYQSLEAIRQDPLMNNSILDSYLKTKDPTNYNKWAAVKSILSTLASALQPAANASWSVLEKQVVKTGLSVEQYSRLDQLVAALGSTVDPAAMKLDTGLTAGRVTVQHNMSMKNVTVVVKFQVAGNTIGSKELAAGGEDYTDTLTLSEGLTMAEVASAVEAAGIAASALRGWPRYEPGNYVPQVSVSPSVTKLNRDITYTITYVPVDCTISYGEGFDGRASETVPYGYRMKLAEHSDATLVYDYTVNGQYFAQGSVYRVEESVQISRRSGMPYTETNLFAVIADNFGTEKESAILTSGALRGNEAIFVRYPVADGEALVRIEDDRLIANPCSSDYQGKMWQPYSYTIVNGTHEDEYLFNGATSVTISDPAFDSIKVVYHLVLDHFSNAAVLKKLQLPETLFREAESQKAVLDKFCTAYQKMGQLEIVKIGALSGMVDTVDLHDDPAKDQELKIFFKGILKSIIDNCFESDGKLKIYHLLGGYLDKNNGGLLYYYRNSDAILGEIDLLSSYLTQMLATEDRVAAVERLVSAVGYEDYAEKISELEAVMAETKGALTPPNSVIDTTSGSLGALVDALEQPGTVNSYTRLPGTLKLVSSPFAVTGASKAAVKINLQVPGKAYTVTMAFDRGHQITGQDVEAIRSAVSAALKNLLPYDEKYYNSNYGGGLDLNSLEGERLYSGKSMNYIWTFKTYTVKVEGSADQVINIENRQIVLPESNSSHIKYTYVVDGVPVSAGRYVFSVEQIDRLFAAGTYAITRKAVNVVAEKLEKMVENLNAALGAGSFVLQKDGEGNYIGLTARIGSNELMGMIMGLMSSGYSYIGLNNEGLVYLNDGGVTEVSLQSLVDAMLHDDDFGSRMLIDLGSGSGKLLTTTMQLGVSMTELHYDLDFEIFLTSVASDIIAASKRLEKVQDDISFYADDGVLRAQIRMPERFSESPAGILLMSGKMDLNNVNAVERAVAYEAFRSYFEVLFGASATAETYTNTLKLFGKNINPAGLESYFQQVKRLMDDAELTCTKDGYALTTVTSHTELNEAMAKSGLDSATLSSVKAIVKECKPGGQLCVDMTVEVLDFADDNGDGYVDTDYEAVIIRADAISESGGRIKLPLFTEDLVSDLGTFSGKYVVVLQKNITGNLTFPGDVILNLNGHIVTGNIRFDGSAVVCDSTLSVGLRGSVNGTVSGDDVTVLSGTYKNSVAPFLKAGYTQESGSGAVVNQVLSYSEDKNGNPVISVDAGILSMGTTPDRNCLELEQYLNFWFRHVYSALLRLDGKDVYKMSIADVLAMSGTESLVPQMSKTVLEQFANRRTAAMLDFDAVRKAIEGDGKVFSYELTAAPWAMNLVYLEGENRFGLSGSAGSAKTVTVTVKVAGKLADKDNLAALNGALDKIIDAEADHDLVRVNAVPFGFETESRLNMSMTVDLTRDFDYAAILGVMLAYGGVNRSAMTKALDAYFQRGDQTALKNELAKITFDQVLTALRAMERTASLSEMIARLGLNPANTSADELEKVYHDYLVGVGASLLDGVSTGESQTLGDDGVYQVTVTRRTEHSDEYLGVSTDRVQVTNLTMKVFSLCNHSWAWEYDSEKHWRACVATPGCTAVIDEGPHELGAWESDADGHWQECECGYVTDKTAHSDAKADSDHDCDTCGRTVGSHSYGSTWVSDSTGHWKVCECGHSSPTVKHNDALDDPDHNCDICGYSMGKHEFDDAWEYDSEGHWHVCTVGGCTMRKDYASHVNKNHDDVCDVCGYVLHEHSFGAGWTADSVGHWHSCAVTGCTVREDYGVHVNENHDNLCDVCRYTIHEHSFGSSWVSDSTGHWYACSVDGCAVQKNYGAHVNRDNNNLCDVCGYVLHQHDFTTEWSSDATCHWHKCGLCSAADIRLEHVYDGVLDSDCNICGYRRSVLPGTSGGFPGIIPPNPNDPDDPVDPDDPIDPDDPVDPEDPIDPDDPIDPEDPVDPVGPTDPITEGIALIGPDGSVAGAASLAEAVAKAEKNGAAIELRAAVAMNGDIRVSGSLVIRGSEKLDQTDGSVFVLTGADACIRSDGAVRVISGTEGLVTVETEPSVYRLAQISDPNLEKSVAGSKVGRLETVYYLFLDADPTKGITYNAFKQTISIDNLSQYDLKFHLADNDGTGLMKTGDKLTVEAYDRYQKKAAAISYIIIVIGDTNCNGKVNTSDATIMKNISNGKSYPLEVLLAADPNFSGTLEKPKVNSSDAAYIMSKCFNWIADKYVSNLK